MTAWLARKPIVAVTAATGPVPAMAVPPAAVPMPAPTWAPTPAAPPATAAFLLQHLGVIGDCSRASGHKNWPCSEKGCHRAAVGGTTAVGSVITGGTAPVLLDPGKEILHQVAPLVGFLMVGPLVFTAGPWGDDRYCATGIQRGEQPVIVKCFACQQNVKRRLVAQWRSSPAVVGLSRKQEGKQRVPSPSHQCRHLCGQPAVGRPMA